MGEPSAQMGMLVVVGVVESESVGGSGCELIGWVC